MYGLFFAGLLLFRTQRASLSDQQSRVLLDLPDGMLLLVDEAGLIRYANQAIGELLGYAPGEILGRPLEHLFEPGARPGLSQLRSRVILAGSAVHAELRGLRKDGRSIPLRVVTRTTRVQGEKISGVFLRDLSEREELAEAVAGRAAELARSNRELEQFTYIASHDLQEPLRMVGSYTQLLQRRYGKTLDDDGRQFLQYAEEGATRMRAFIDDLLAFSRLGTRGDPFRPISLDTLVAQVLANLRETIRASKAVVTVGPMPELEGDFLQLSQVFQNLIGNALKFHGAGEPHVRIAAERDGPEWRFSVSDDGIGILPEYYDRIFIIFQRLHTREEYSGTGIGLAVCKKVVERHGGRIWLESTGRPGEGTTFFFTLPAERKKIAPVAAPVLTPKDAELKTRALTMIEARLKDLV